MKLYYSPGACSLASHIALNEAGLKHLTEKVDIKKHEIAGHSFYDINPKGYVPVLELDDGQLLTENAVILQYIADQNPESGLIPKQGDFKRYKVEEWLNFIATEIHKAFGPFFKPNVTDEEKAEATEKISKKFDIIEASLAKNDYLTGATCTVADFYLFVMLMWGKMNKFEMNKWPSFSNYMQKMKSRPAVMETLKDEKLPVH